MPVKAVKKGASEKPSWYQPGIFANWKKLELFLDFYSTALSIKCGFNFDNEDKSRVRLFNRSASSLFQYKQMLCHYFQITQLKFNHYNVYMAISIYKLAD